MSTITIGLNVHERLPVITNAAHCARALSLYESGDLYFAIGRTIPWEGEEKEGFVPPAPNLDATTLDQLVGMKKAERVAMVAPDPNGAIEYANIKFKTLTQDQALAEKARWILVETRIAFDDLPPISYRQIGVFSRVRPKEGFEGKQILMPEEIQDVGILEILNNRKVVTRQSDTKDRYFMIIEC